MIAGHRRFNAIKKLISENRLPEDYEVLAKKVDEDEDELVTRLKLHETNLQTRSLLKMPEEEKIAIIDDYMDILDKAKKQGVQINGKPVKGKTRDLIAERFGISHYTAQKLIRKAKEQGGEEEGAKISPQKKTAKKPITQLKKIETQLEKLEFEGTEEEQEIKKKWGYPIAKYFSPFIPLNQFCGTEDVTLNSFYIWTSYDKDKQIIENPSMKIDQAILQKLHIRD